MFLTLIIGDFINYQIRKFLRNNIIIFLDLTAWTGENTINYFEVRIDQVKIILVIREREGTLNGIALNISDNLGIIWNFDVIHELIFISYAKNKLYFI